MIEPSANYFRYFPVPPELSIWGLGVTAAGYAVIPPSLEYPPSKHPEGYHFHWEDGRVLNSVQFLYLNSGSGILETQTHGEIRLEAGMCFLLLPNVWHRYRPDAETGWVESWIELGGPVVDALVASKTLHDQVPVLFSGDSGKLAQEMAEIQRLARDGVGFFPEMSAASLRILTLWTRMGDEPQATTGTKQAVLLTQRHLDQHYAEPVDVEALANELGVAYSHLRREFREYTGFAPWQYVVQLRLLHAKRMLISGNEKLEEIAQRLGFSSGFHLSQSFKKAFGISPGQWRKGG